MSTSLAYGQFFTYSEWERLPEEERQVYLAGAFGTVVAVTEAEDPWGLKKSLHYRQCIRDSHMTLKELSQNVIICASKARASGYVGGGSPSPILAEPLRRSS